MSGQAPGKVTPGDLAPGRFLAGDSIAATRRALARLFTEAGIEQPELDARILVGHAVGLDLTGLAREAARALTAAEAATLVAFASRRLAHEPIALIIGEKEFWGLRLRVTRATLVPRPETETLVETALAFATRQTPVVPAAGAQPLDPHFRGDEREINSRNVTPRLRIADLGTGSGAILLALLHSLPEAHGVGVDISAEALAVARDNARALGLGDRAAFLRGSFADALAPGFDLVVSNPPYLREDELGGVAADVREHEPQGALVGGVDGLAAYRAIAGEAARVLKRGGQLLVEIGQGQADAVTAIMVADGLAVAGPGVADLAGITRVLPFARA